MTVMIPLTKQLFSTIFALLTLCVVKNLCTGGTIKYMNRPWFNTIPMFILHVHQLKCTNIDRKLQPRLKNQLYVESKTMPTTLLSRSRTPLAHLAIILFYSLIKLFREKAWAIILRQGVHKNQCTIPWHIKGVFPLDSLLPFSVAFARAYLGTSLLYSV